MTVREMLIRMDAYELGEWKVLYDLDPWGDLRDDYRSALQTSYLVDIHRDRKKRATPFPAKDFLLTFIQPAESLLSDTLPTPEKIRKAKQVVSHIETRLAQIQFKRALKGKVA